jgi:RNA recognition motif-containing protein
MSSMTKIRIATDKKTGRSRGFAYLDFSDKESAEVAVAALAGLQCEGR